MGQSLSGHTGADARTHEELRKQLAQKFANKCFTSIEIFCLQETFQTLAAADHAQQSSSSTPTRSSPPSLSQDAIARFLELPDALGAAPVLFRMLSSLGAFPFCHDADAAAPPAAVGLGLDETVIVTSLLTGRYQTILADKGAAGRRRLLFQSLAVQDDERHLNGGGDGEEKDNKATTTTTTTTTSEHGEDKEQGKKNRNVEGKNNTTNTSGFAKDQPVGEDELGDEGEDDDDVDDDELVLSTLASLGAVDDASYKRRHKETLRGAMIPADNLWRLITLLLICAPLGPQERLSQLALDLDCVRSAADSVLAAFLNVERSPGVRFQAFNNVLPVCLEYMFDGLSPLFEHFLFSKSLEFTKKDEKPAAISPSIPTSVPLLPDSSNILNHGTLSQISFFIPGSELFRRLRLLYSGDKDGFSMGSFESSVFNWRAPTILLVKGTRCSESTSGNEERFAASLPPKRYPDGSSSARLTFGLYLRQPWRHVNKECFGDADTLLFQLEPVHDVFPASTLNRDYVSFSKPGASSTNTGIAVGNPPPKPTASYGRQSTTHLGPVSLLLDDGFEFGVFTHDYTSRGGAFQNSISRKFNFQDRFEVDSLEVWGCGGDEEAKGQAERWAFEAREAEARRRINLGTGDIEADRALLEMAGLVGGNRSGGSMA